MCFILSLLNVELILGGPRVGFSYESIRDALRFGRAIRPIQSADWGAARGPGDKWFLFLGFFSEEVWFPRDGDAAFRWRAIARTGTCSTKTSLRAQAGGPPPPPPGGGGGPPPKRCRWASQTQQFHWGALQH